MTSSCTEADLFLGYDARYCPNTSLLKSIEYRQRHLFKKDVSALASVDAAIWPSIFDLKKTNKRPAFVGPIQDLWIDKNALLKCLPVSEPHLGIIAIKLVFSEKSRTYLDEWNKRVEPLQYFQTSHTWKLLGYDVADKYLLSSLFNCGLGERGNFIRLEGKPIETYLNDSHLFVGSNEANQFAFMSNELVKEHAPFFSYEIWQTDVVAQEMGRNNEHVSSI